jgi:transcriptional regulator with XRE-family HTH domain
MNFSGNLQELMKANKMTQTRLAELMKTSQQTISRWIKGINQPDFETLCKLCHVLDSTPNELLGWEE